MNNSSFLLTVFILQIINVIRCCSPDLCFNWKVSRMKLTLVCTIDNFIFKAFIDDPRDKTQADCLPPFKVIQCESKYKNGTVTYNQTTKEMTFVLTGIITEQVNGNWTCRHGANKGIAHVEVTVLTLKETIDRDNKMEAVFGYSCIDQVISLSALSFILTVAVTLVFLSLTTRTSYVIDDCAMRIACYKTRKRRIECVPKLKKCGFAMLTVLLFCGVFLVGLIDHENCSSKMLFIGVGILPGFLFTLLFLNKDKNFDKRTDTVEDQMEYVTYQQESDLL